MYDLKKQVYIDKIAYTKGPLMSIFVWFFLFEMFFIIHFFTLRHKFFLHSLNKAPICSPFINKEYFQRIFLLPDRHRASFLMVSSGHIRMLLQVGKMLLVQLYSRHLKTLPCPSDTHGRTLYQGASESSGELSIRSFYSCARINYGSTLQLWSRSVS